MTASVVLGMPLVQVTNSTVSQNEKPRTGGAFRSVLRVDQCTISSGMISSATMLMILISGFTAGPAVSL